MEFWEGKSFQKIAGINTDLIHFYFKLVNLLCKPIYCILITIDVVNVRNLGSSLVETVSGKLKINMYWTLNSSETRRPNSLIIHNGIVTLVHDAIRIQLSAH